MSEGTSQAGGKMEELCYSCKRGWKTNDEKTRLQHRLCLNEHPCFPISINLIKIKNVLLSPHFTTENNPIPSPDYSSACSYVRHLSFVAAFWCLRSTWGSHDYISSTSSLHPSSPSCGCSPSLHLWSGWEKSLRTNPTINFQQRRENTSTVIQFNVVLFSSSPTHISFESFCNNVTHTHTLINWLYHVSCSHVSVTCSLCSLAGLLMAWLKPNEFF